MKISYITESFKGFRNKINKDSLLVLEKEEYILFVLFDGVSSAKNAKIGVEESLYFIKKNYKSFLKKDNLSLSNLMYETNQYLLNKNIDEAYTTYVALYIDKKGNNMLISNLGDSRIYGISKQYINQYSRDDKGSLLNRITRCLGMKNLNKDDFTENFINEPEKKLLLCSDGFYSFLENEKLTFLKTLNFKRLQDIRKRIEKEIKNNNEDDASYILINSYV